jgi:hypothetical protein
MAEVTDVALARITVRSEVDLETLYKKDFLETKIADAVALIVDESPGLADRLRSGALSRNNYERVVFDVVMRVFRNPGGMDSESEGGYSYSARNTVASGDFWLTDRDRRTLNGFSSPMSIGTVSMGVDAGWGGRS